MHYSYELSDDLFDKDKGEVKPVKSKKKLAANGKKPNPLKRSFEDTEVSAQDSYYPACDEAQ